MHLSALPIYWLGSPAPKDLELESKSFFFARRIDGKINWWPRSKNVYEKQTSIYGVQHLIFGRWKIWTRRLWKTSQTWLWKFRVLDWSQDPKLWALSFVNKSLNIFLLFPRLRTSKTFVKFRYHHWNCRENFFVKFKIDMKIAWTKLELRIHDLALRNRSTLDSIIIYPKTSAHYSSSDRFA